jgi:hypothetical protein
MPLTDLTPPYCCACPKLGPEFPTSYVMTFTMFNDLRWELIVRFVDFGEIVHHNCFNFSYASYFPSYGQTVLF